MLRLFNNSLNFIIALVAALLIVEVEMVEEQMKNLTSITWAHAVNTQQMLTDVLNSDIEMIEADIVLGTLINDPTNLIQPVMAHPPNITSDISLNSFLEQILMFNSNDSVKTKGVKLDFKSTEVFSGSVNTLKTMWNLMDYPVWINADIISGPLNNTDTIPVDPNVFLEGCKQLNKSVLSIGWTTKWGPNFNIGSYTDDQIDNMIEAIKTNKINETGNEITFPVRAGIAAQSMSNLMRLKDALNETNPITITIWSSADDNVNVNMLRNLIFTFGLDKVYIDVPENLLNQLDLSTAPAKASNLLIHVSVIILCFLWTRL